MARPAHDDGLTSKQRYNAKKYAAAPFVNCACGCGEKIKSFDQNGRARKFISGHNGRRYEGDEAKSRAIQKRYRLNNPDKLRIANRDYYRMRKLKAMALLGNVCAHCGTPYDGTNAPIFEFHHSDPSEKEIGVTRILINWAWERVVEEMNKCVLLCANCHNKHHGGTW